MKGADAPETWEGSPCDERYGGDARAAKCPLFACARTKEMLREGFDGFLDGASLPEIADRYPDMAALMWVLNEESPPPAPLTDEDPSEDLASPPVEPPAPEDPPPPDPAPEPPAPPPEESGVEDPEDDSEDDSEDDEEELARSLTPFRPPTWKLLLVSALLYVQRRIDAMLEAMRRG
jgi:hypothetical protein